MQKISSYFSEKWQNEKKKVQSYYDYIVQNPRTSAAVAITLATLYTINKFKPKFKANTILEFDFSKIRFSDAPVVADPLDALFNPNSIPSIFYRDFIDALTLASKEKRIIGLICYLGTGSNLLLDLAQVEEVREAITNFKQSGKKTLCYADSIGHFQNGLKAYYFASVFDNICICNMGEICMPGFLGNSMFIRELLEDKLGAEVLIEAREKYKTFANFFKQDKMTDEHREQVQSILSGLENIIVPEIAQARNTTVEVVKEWLNKGIFNAQQALDAKIIDALAFRDGAYENIVKLCGLKEKKEANFLFLTKVMEKLGPNSRPYATGNTIVAIVYLQGGIQDGEGNDGIFSVNASAAIRQAREDKDVKAIILRVNSPGGSALASDVILHEIELAKKAGKKIIVSMGAVAASGGYWISAHADAIVANKLTITGSIGVIFGKVNIRQTYKKLGINYDHVTTSKRGTILSEVHGYTDDERQWVTETLDGYYDQFLDLVSKGRNIEKSAIRSIAQGKVYFGTVAKEIKLVDEIGGLSKAIEVTRRLLNLKDEKIDTIQLKQFPKPKSALARFLSGGKQAENSDEMEKQQAGNNAVNGIVAQVREAMIAATVQAGLTWFLPGRVQAMSSVASSGRVPSMVQAMMKSASAIEAALNQQGVLAVDPMLVMTEFM